MTQQSTFLGTAHTQQFTSSEGGEGGVGVLRRYGEGREEDGGKGEKWGEVLHLSFLLRASHMTIYIQTTK